jgi:hypothetical protein
MMIAGLREKVVRLSSLTVNTTQRRRKWKMTRRKICSLNASLSRIPLNKRSRLLNLNSNLRRKEDLPVKEMSKVRKLRINRLT